MTIPEGIDPLAHICWLLTDFYTPAEASTWMSIPHPQLDGETPKDVVAAGRADEVLAIIERLRDMVYL